MEEEIDLRDYINVLVKWKWLIIWVTVISMLVAGVYSYFIAKPVYETSGTLLVNPQVAKVNITSPEQLLNPITYLPEISVMTYINVIKSNTIKARIVSDLNRKSSFSKLTIDDLGEIIRVTNPKRTTLIKISADYNNPKIAKEIVDDVLKETVSYINSLNNSHLRLGGDALKKQFLDAKAKLESIENSIAEFNSQKDNLSTLSLKRNAYKSALSNYFSQLLSLNSKISQYREQISTTAKELKLESEFITTKKSILDDPLLSQLAQDLSNENIIYLSKLKVDSQEINPVYVNLKTKLVNYAITLSGLNAQKTTLSSLILQTQDKIHQLDEEVNDKQLKLSVLNRELSLAKSNYEKIAANYEQLQLAQNNMLSPITIADEPLLPTHPIKPKKLFNIVVAGTAGFFFAILLVFFLEYMQGDEDKKRIEKTAGDSNK